MSKAQRKRTSTAARPFPAPGPVSGPARVAHVLQEALERGDLEQADLDLALDRLGVKRIETRQSRGRREDIIGAAIRIFSRKGYHAATLQDIADELGLTRPAFYYYFKSKQEILEAICYRTADETDAVVREALARPASDARAALEALLAEYAQHMAGEEATAVLMRNYEEMSPASQAELSERRRIRERGILALVRRGVASGELNAPHPHIALLCALETIHAMYHWYRPEGELARERVVALVVRQIMDGLAPR